MATLRRVIGGLLAALGITLGAVSHAQAQVYPSIPPNTVLGRLGSGNPGPPQAISFTTLAGQLSLSAALTIGSNPITGGTSQGLLYDQGGVLGLLAPATTGVLTYVLGSPLISQTLPAGLSYPLIGLLVGNGSSPLTAYAGASCTNQFISALSAAGAATCNSVTNSDLTAGSFTNITGVGTLTAGTWNADVIGSNYGGTGVANGSSTITLAASLTTTGAGAATLAFGSSTATYTFPSASATMAFSSGTLTNGHCVSINGSGAFVDAGGACTTGGGGGTVSSGTANQVAYYASTGTVVSGNNNFIFNGTSVGIGTSSLSGGRLTVQQSSDTSFSGFDVTNTAATAGGFVWEDTSNNFRIDSKGNGAGVLVLNGASTAGNVLIGTTTASGFLTVNGTIASTGNFSTSKAGDLTISTTNSSSGNYAELTTNQGGASAALLLNTGTGTAWQLLSGANNAFATLFNSGSAFATLTNAGKLGINTNSPAGTLDIEPPSGTATACINGSTNCTDLFPIIYKCTGTDTAALNTLIASGIAALTISGTCVVTTLNTLPANFALRAQNPVNDVLETSSGTGNVVTMNSGGGDTIENIGFNSSVTRTSGDFIYAQGGNVAINHVVMINPFIGIELNGVGSPGTSCPSPYNGPCFGAHVSNVNIYGTSSIQSGSECLLADGVSGSANNPDNDAYIENVNCTGLNGSDKFTNGFEIQASGEIHIVHADFENVSGANILVDPNGSASTGHYIAWLDIDDALLDAAATYGLKVIATNGAGIQNVDIHDGWVANNGYGIWVGTDTGNGSSIIEVKIHHEHIINQTNDGIHLDNGSNIGTSYIDDNFVDNASGTNSGLFIGNGVGGWNIHNNSFAGSTNGGFFPSTSLSDTAAIGNFFYGTTPVDGSPTLTINSLNSPSIP